MTLSVLVTQCLQRDFVGLVPAHEPLPNRLHVGREEALRLLGPDPASGPVAQLVDWARAQDETRLQLLHVRDWHDASDARQRDHLASFGAHCLRGSAGAELVAGIEDGLACRPNERLVDSLGLSDFEDTSLPGFLAELAERAGPGGLRVGVVGVWTEAKVSFLLYDLKTRGKIDALGTCSALTASASRTQHFNALEQLQRLLGVASFDSVGDFAAWLLPSGSAPRLLDPPRRLHARLELPSETSLAPDDRDLVGWLYRDSARVALTPLGGGFSGARVFRAESWDAFGHAQAPSVVKVGPRKLIGSERAAFERVEAVLGNNAPSVRDFVDLGEEAGIKYAFAAMGHGRVRTLKALFETDVPQAELDAVLRVALEDILGKLYAAAQYERLPLLEHYGFRPDLARHVRPRVEALVGAEAARAPRLRFGRDFEVGNLCAFYERFLGEEPEEPGEHHFASYVHGDLNGANVLVDGRDNVWLIDFFHTARGHVLKDVAKLENDLLYIFTPVASEEELEEGLAITRALRRVDDLAAPLPDTLEGIRSPAFVRAWQTLRTLRAVAGGLVRSDRKPRQLSVALLRYAAHTLSFDESSPLQKRWALAAACGHADDVIAETRLDRRLRVDWLAPESLAMPGRLGMTLCPGRKDRGRDLERDLDDLAAAGAKHLLCLLGDDELEWAGIPGLREAARRRGLGFAQHPIPDQCAPSIDDAHRLVGELRTALAAGDDVVLHCMGGLGRTGTLAACVLVASGHAPDVAIASVRRSRGPRAVETPAQEDFVSSFAAALAASRGG